MKVKTGAVLVALLLFTACDEKAAKRLNEAAAAIGLVQDIAIDAHERGLLTEGETRDVVVGTLRLSEAGKSAVVILRAVRDGDEGSKRRAIDALGIVADELKVFTDRLEIKNDTARREIETALLLVQTSLNSARVILAASE